MGGHRSLKKTLASCKALGTHFVGGLANEALRLANRGAYSKLIVVVAILQDSRPIFSVRTLAGSSTEKM